MRLEILSNLGAGIGCLAYSALLLARSDRTLLHARVGLFLAVLGSAMTTRALAWATGSSGLTHLMLVGFGLFPLPLALYFETLLRRPLHLPAKLALLLATAFFIIGGWTTWAVARPGFVVALVAYHTLVVGYLGALAALAYRRLARGPLRSLVGASLVVCALSLPLMVTDWLELAAVHLPRLGALPTLLLLFLAGASIHTAGESRLRSSFRRLVATLLFGALLAAGIVVALAGRLSARDGWVVAAVLVAAAMVFEPFRHHLAVSRLQRTDLLLRRLSRLPADRLDHLVAEIGSWPELERVQHLRADQLVLESPARVASYVDDAGALVSRAQVRQGLALASAPEQLFVLDQLRFLMDNHDVDHLALLHRRGDFLGVRFAMGSEPDEYRSALGIIATMGRLCAAREA